MTYKTQTKAFPSMASAVDSIQVQEQKGWTLKEIKEIEVSSTYYVVTMETDDDQSRHAGFMPNIYAGKEQVNDHD